MTIQFVTVSVDELARFAENVFRALGLPDEEATLCADGLMQSELRCLPGQMQGVSRLPVYRERIQNRLVHFSVPFEVIREGPGLALVDAHNGLGHVVAAKAMALAVRKAKQVGQGTVTVRHATHFGSAGNQARRALTADCIGIATSNAGPEMAPWGGITPVLGTNPWAVAVPTGGQFPVVLDMALTTAGKGMMQWLDREHRKMPLDWAITREGHTTDEPRLAMEGTLLPIGGPKGYGFSLITDVLTGVLSGSAYGSKPYSAPSAQDVGYMVSAIDIDWFMPVTDFKARMQSLISEIKASALRPGFEAIYLPGELEYLREQEKRTNGAPLDRETFEALRNLARDLRIDFPF